MRYPHRVLVVVPARDEADLVDQCLESVTRALDAFIASGGEAGDEGGSDEPFCAGVAVVAHRCTDATEAVARAALDRWVDDHRLGLVVSADDAETVGQVRSTGVERFIADHDWPRDGATWIFSTDADSVVPTDWVTGTLAEVAAAADDMEGAQDAEPVAVAGMVDLDRWDTTPQAIEAYDRVLREGYGPVSVRGRTHQHVYGANLAVRVDAYDGVGGFPAVLPHGEDHGLVRALEARGDRVISPEAPRVQTSARVPGRVAAGLGALLGSLEEATQVAALLPLAASEWQRLVEGVREGQWDHPTPCEGWTVRDLVNHLVGEQLWAPHLLAGQSLDEVGDRYDGDLVGDDPMARAASSMEGFLAAWREVAEGHGLARVHTSAGLIETSEYAHQMLADLVVHGWDIARATGQEPHPPAEAVADALAYEGPRVQEGWATEIFEPPVPTETTEPLDQLVALLGRDPGWRPPARP